MADSRHPLVGDALAGDAIGFRTADRVAAVAVAPRVDVPSNRGPTRAGFRSRRH
ncbi:hypothetical protein [Halobellus litoreus]|uniref:Uncharacterized protein n=1 Tax=Halobellus litoreus TaxID=755310 RepID=A0ABD6DZB1_9EURY|nr:hypothetical protein [Halobellus litoreus]